MKNVKGEVFTNLEGAMWDLHILDNRDCKKIGDLLEILKESQRDVADDIEAAEENLAGLRNKRHEIQALLAKYERKESKVTP